jgi:GTP-binding protein
MVGRSNVGKSSLINALVHQKVARTSAAPGKTRLANYYLIEDAYYLVDLPGYGYARGGAESVETFETLTKEYFDPASQPDRQVGGVLHVIDSRHPDLPHDSAAHGWLIRTSLPIAVIATKVDKLTQSERAQALKALGRKYDGVPVVAESAFDGTGLPEIWKLIRQWTGVGSPRS